MFTLVLAFAACGHALAPLEGGVMPGTSCSPDAEADVPAVPTDVFFTDTEGCTLIGCDDGFVIDVHDTRGAAVDSFHVDAVVDGVQDRFDCGPPGPATPPECYSGPSQATFAGTPRHVDLTVTTPDGRSFQGCVVPHYVVHQFNGPGCPPICRFALARITVR